VKKAGIKCEHVGANGHCNGTPRTGSNFCFFHDPNAEESREAAKKAGGIARSRKAAVLAADTFDLPLHSVDDVSKLLAGSINQVRRGEIDPRIANAVGYLSGILLKAMEQGRIDARLEAVEAIIKADAGKVQ